MSPGILCMDDMQDLETGELPDIYADLNKEAIAPISQTITDCPINEFIPLEFLPLAYPCYGNSLVDEIDAILDSAPSSTFDFKTTRDTCDISLNVIDSEEFSRLTSDDSLLSLPCNEFEDSIEFPDKYCEDELANIYLKDDAYLENIIDEQLGFPLCEGDVPIETPQFLESSSSLGNHILQPVPVLADTSEIILGDMFPHMKDENNRRRRPLLYENNEKARIASQSRPKYEHKPQYHKRPDALLNHDYTNKKSKEEKFICPVENCSRTYSKSSHLKSHLRRHSGEKPFACTYENCTWKFSRSDELARHRRSHFGIKPFKCETCSKSFGRSDHLAKHRKVHGRRMARYEHYMKDQ